MQCALTIIENDFFGKKFKNINFNLNMYVFLSTLLSFEKCFQIFVRVVYLRFLFVPTEFFEYNGDKT